MNVIPYIMNGNCYVISSFADPNNPLFTTDEEIEDFKLRVERQLGSICEILGYAFHADHFQILVTIKERESFIEFYNEKYETELDGEEIIESNYIFSQQMANLLSGFAKKFNFIHKRFGSLFGRRFTKILIESEEEIEFWVQKMNRADRLWSFEKLWSYLWNFAKMVKKSGKIKVGLGIRNAEELEVARESDVLAGMLLSFQAFKLRGQYVVTPLSPHFAEKLAQK